MMDIRVLMFTDCYVWIRLSPSENAGVLSDVNGAAPTMDACHDNPIAGGKKKRNSLTTCVSQSQHINLMPQPAWLGRHPNVLSMWRFR